MLSMLHFIASKNINVIVSSSCGLHLADLSQGPICNQSTCHTREHCAMPTKLCSILRQSFANNLLGRYVQPTPATYIPRLAVACQLLACMPFWLHVVTDILAGLGTCCAAPECIFATFRGVVGGLCDTLGGALRQAPVLRQAPLRRAMRAQ